MGPCMGAVGRSRVRIRVGRFLGVVLAGVLSAAGCAVPPPDVDCEVPATDSGIAIVGDSVFSLAKRDCTHVGRRLEEMTGTSFLDESVSGATLGVIPQAPGGSIVTQYTQGVAPANPRAVVFDGGTNDLFWRCPVPARPDCVVAIDVMEGQLRSLIGQMRADGVEDIVYLGMYHLSPTGLFASLGTALDPWNARASAVAEELGVIFVDPRDVFDENPAYLAGDGMHPSASGSMMLAELVHDALVDNGIVP